MLTRRKLLQATALTTLGMNAMTETAEASLRAEALPVCRCSAFHRNFQS